MIHVQKILFLKNVPLFSSMPPEELSHLASIAQEVVFPAGATIITAGDHGDSMFVIAEGDVSIHREGETLAEFTSQDYFGEMSILDGEPRSASVTALCDCLLLRIKQADFHQILSSRFEVALHVIQTLTQRLRQASAPPQTEKDSSDASQTS